ncbi:MAG: BatD family protein [Bacteroidota bacterium]
MKQPLAAVICWWMLGTFFLPAQQVRTFLNGTILPQEAELVIYVQVIGPDKEVVPIFPEVTGAVKGTLQQQERIGPGGLELTFSQVYLLRDTGNLLITPVALQGLRRPYFSDSFHVRVLPGQMTEKSSSWEALPEAYSIELSLSCDTCIIGQRLEVEVTLVYPEQEGLRIDLDEFEISRLRQHFTIQDFWEERTAMRTYQARKDTTETGINIIQPLYQTLLFPIQEGIFSFDSLILEGTLIQGKADANALQILTGQNQRIQKIQLPLSGKQVSVIPPPQEIPDGTPIGVYEIKSLFNKQEVTTGEPFVFNLICRGTGNLSLLPAPEMPAFESFAVYDPVSSLRPSKTIGEAGEKIFSYEIVAAYPGNYQLGPLKLIYFDPERNVLDSTYTGTFDLNVQGKDRPEVLQSPLAGFYRRALEDADTTPVFWANWPGMGLLLLGGLSFLMLLLHIWKK